MNRYNDVAMLESKLSQEIGFRTFAEDQTVFASNWPLLNQLFQQSFLKSPGAEPEQTFRHTGFETLADLQNNSANTNSTSFTGSSGHSQRKICV
ncbi:hypothetical protein [Alteromonas sp. RKMC-009]|uniref:hypothetical protein n=1 Tax=Alteromonas sp. RKMC-009 TaxID=2267264 RepID=UPI000E69BDF3|nr:hypothetical protein [Alteromonas sp. RKMC-009]AYA63949.1 hypothetical protein DS731_08020 [Alteromonas sp. RKMC-009]